MSNVSECPECGGVLTLVPNPSGDRSMNDPGSRMKYVCAKDDMHVFEDPSTTPVDRSRSIADR